MKIVWRVSLAVTVVLLAVTAAQADVLRSPNYQINEDIIGSGGLINESSPNFKASEAIGDTATGTSSSTNFQAESGFTTTADPALSFTVNTSSINFGPLSIAATATATASFSIVNYTSYGYSVSLLGNPPSNGSHTLAALASNTASQTGVEQFGINLAQNSQPISFGAGPVGGAGVATSNYGTANSFRYVNGEAIAQAPKSSALTSFTISYIVNMAAATPNGSYSGAETLVCTGTY